MYKNCLKCLKEFKSKKFHGKFTKFCSHVCYWNSMVGKKPIVSIEKITKKLGAWNKGMKMPEFSGVNHPRWILDRTKLARNQERNDSAYGDWRKQVWLRDNFKCKIANPDCKGRIEAHHILGWSNHPKLRYEINNGITLCHAHHPRKREDEAKLSPYFQKLVAKMK